MIPTNDNLPEAGLNLLLYQFSDKTNIKTILDEYLKGIHEIQNDLFTLVDSFNIEDATGIYLDYLGRLVGELRNDDNDEDYRKRIKIRLLINNSKGTPNELLDILSQLTETSNVRIWEHFPVSTLMYTDGNNATLRTLEAMKSASPITSNTVLVVDTTRNGFVSTELLPDYPISNTKKDVLAEILDTYPFLVDENDNNFVNEIGDTLVVLGGGNNTFSYYGIFNEVTG